MTKGGMNSTGRCECKRKKKTNVENCYKHLRAEAAFGARLVAERWSENAKLAGGGSVSGAFVCSGWATPGAAEGRPSKPRLHEF